MQLVPIIYLILTIIISILLFIMARSIKNKKKWGKWLGLLLEILLTIVKIISLLGFIALMNNPLDEIVYILNSIGLAYTIYMVFPGINIVVIVISLITLTCLILSERIIIFLNDPT